MHARVVDFPLPAGPEIRTRPFESPEKPIIFSGIPSACGSGSENVMTLTIAESAPLCL